MSIQALGPKEVIQEKLAFPRAFLVLLKETELFGPLLDKAIEDIDAAMGETERNVS